MNLKRRNGPRVIAALLLFSVAQVSLQISFAEPTTTATPIPVQTVARLTTRNNQPIQVNGLSATTGASIVSGATLETGADQSATVTVGALGSVEMGPNTKLVLTFDEQRNLKALVLFGCAKLSARTNATGEVATDQGSVGTTNPASGGDIEVRYQPGTTPAVGQGVCQTGAGTTPVPNGGGQGGLFGLGLPGTIAVVGAATAAGLTPLFFQEDNFQANPSRAGQ
ncbi:MAG TPA: hypothetical protein VFZ22_15380 [Pyrinomonadaceae bacterium]|nr:hypothetical protein [Pyrinomonadaceae bacterium]